LEVWQNLFFDIPTFKHYAVADGMRRIFLTAGGIISQKEPLERISNRTGPWLKTENSEKLQVYNN